MRLDVLRPSQETQAQREETKRLYQEISELAPRPSPRTYGIPTSYDSSTLMGVLRQHARIGDVSNILPNCFQKGDKQPLHISFYSGSETDLRPQSVGIGYDSILPEVNVDFDPKTFAIKGVEVNGITASNDFARNQGFLLGFMLSAKEDVELARDKWRKDLEEKKAQYHDKLKTFNPRAEQNVMAVLGSMEGLVTDYVLLGTQPKESNNHAETDAKPQITLYTDHSVDENLAAFIANRHRWGDMGRADKVFYERNLTAYYPTTEERGRMVFSFREYDIALESVYPVSFEYSPSTRWLREHDISISERNFASYLDGRRTPEITPKQRHAATLLKY